MAFAQYSHSIVSIETRLETERSILAASEVFRPVLTCIKENGKGY